MVSIAGRDSQVVAHNQLRAHHGIAPRPHHFQSSTSLGVNNHVRRRMSSTSSGSNLEGRFDAAARPKDGVQQGQRHLHATGLAKLTSGHHSRGSTSKPAAFSTDDHRVRNRERRTSSLRSTGLTTTTSSNAFPGQAICTLTRVQGRHACRTSSSSWSYYADCRKCLHGLGWRPCGSKLELSNVKSRSQC